MRYIKIVTPIIAIFFLASCEKETTADVSRTVKVTYPTITIKGDQLVILPVGGTFSDAGATLLDDISGASTSIQATKGTVNTAVPGLYVLTYAASNANGFEASASRLIAVTSINNPIDRSGTYKRTATGVNAVITKVANGVYRVKNPGGAGVGENLVVYFVETALNTYVAPTQPTADGPTSVTNINFTATGATWNVVNSGYGTALRTFVKQ